MYKRFAYIAIIAFLTIKPAFAGDITGTVKAIGVKNSGNAVIYIEKIEGKTFNVPEKHMQMDQKNLTFVPHVLPVMVGTTVDFLNSDDVLHNVFSPDKCAEKFNLGTWPKGEMRSYAFNTPGCRPILLCNVHPEMEAFVVVLESPYFAVSAKDGAYTISNVPPGTYTLSIWHEKLKGESVQITITDQGSVNQDFIIKR